MKWSRVLTADEFTNLCARVRARGRFIRHYMPVKNAGYRVAKIERWQQPVVSSQPRPRATTKRRRCPDHVAQLWFDIMKAQ